MFEEIFSWVIPRLQGTGGAISTVWQPIQDSFPVIWVADGSTLEQLRRHLKILRGETETVLAGKMMVVVELLTHRPVKVSYTQQPKANDKTFDCWLLEQLPVGGLLVFDLGFFKFPWFDQFTQERKYFVTRQREKTAARVTKTLSSGPRYRDELIQLGQYRSHPCRHPVRMVSVLWDATWIFYALLNDLCTQVAVALHQPLDKISLEMVFRGLYHYAQDVLKGTQTSVIDFLVEHHRLLALVKITRKRQRKRDAQFQEIWGFPALS